MGSDCYFQPHQDPRSLQTLRVSRHEPLYSLGGATRPLGEEGLRTRRSCTTEIDTILPTSRRSLHNQKKTCASCGYPAAKIRKCTSSTFGALRLSRPPSERALLTRAQYRQLVREGEAQKGYRYRPHAVPQHRLEAFQERLPDRCPQGLRRPRHFHCCIIWCYDGQERGRWDESFSASGVTGAGHFSDGPTRFSLQQHKWHGFAQDSVQWSLHPAKVMKNGVTFADQSHRFLSGQVPCVRARRTPRVQQRTDTPVSTDRGGSAARASLEADMGLGSRMGYLIYISTGLARIL